MTSPVANNVINKQSIADLANATIVKPQSDLISWYNGYNPAQNYQYIANTWYGSYSNSAFSDADLGSSTVSSMGTGDIPDTLITTSSITTAFVAYAKLASRVRKVRVTKYYNYGNCGTSAYGVNYFYDATAYVNFAADQATITDPAILYNPITAANIVDLATRLYNQAIVNRDTTVTYNENWCHNNCHCNYSARGRR